MAFYVVMLVTVLNHISFKGSKVLITLYALDLGANPLTTGKKRRPSPRPVNRRTAARCSSRRTRLRRRVIS